MAIFEGIPKRLYISIQCFSENTSPLTNFNTGNMFRYFSSSWINLTVTGVVSPDDCSLSPKIRSRISVIINWIPLDMNYLTCVNIFWVFKCISVMSVDHITFWKTHKALFVDLSSNVLTHRRANTYGPTLQSQVSYVKK